MARTKATHAVEDTDENHEIREQQVRDAREQTARHPAGNSSVVPERDSRGQLTRAGMEHVIAGRGSVSWKGRIHTSIDTLPTSGDLAEGDTKAEDDALNALDEREAALKRERAAILDRRKGAKASAKESKASKKKDADETESEPGTTQLPPNPNDLNRPNEDKK